MTRTLAFVFSALIPLAAWAADGTAPSDDSFVRPAGDSELSDFLWVNRPIVVFADTPADPRFQQQIDMLLDGEQAMRDRDVVVLTDTDPSAKSPIRAQLRPRGFQMVFVDKDGVVKLRKPSPWSVREIGRSIDKTPLREREIRERREGG
ncbi:MULTISPECIES: DUF4174 domain-containing protein [unclassified Ruegeria]|uniref:DUF4174 domain-containing protein n=1 Tax=unclassified Ruegeria TaxID=2625375 RepID=UPI0014885D81|nr:MULTISPECIES: DUF4174 domain-containing protein [unclassified Ruegeria]NOD34659.1 DUF4174 domain-containing protein [Ruegeria sp. HKCCD7296]NOD48275.1 DUF4174 domain-containing protein [Ruegeria sp. HKCCD5849]NOD52295.1 DUF4174 domain-containing protein [Ruegeria sp. HKCCD5851]NOD68398.1 DUF4174 domain-containing protein [Ruegeria sp. HKCCD7303]NOE34795.1 DUF4174 domain-containing protein [Ruegeria sp. HKCCD7318]